MDVHGKDLGLQLARLLLLRLWGLVVLLDVEFAKQHDGLLPEDTTRNGIGPIDAWTGAVSHVR